MKTVFILHASYTNPDGHWYPSLKSELEQQGYQVFVPHFPTPEHQSLADWEQVFDAYRQHIDSETIFIGHSVGCAFILHQLQRLTTPVRGCIFVAPIFEPVEHQGLNLVDATFITQSFDWHYIHQMMGDVVVIGSDNDPFIASDHIARAGDMLGVDPVVVLGKGHFTDADGVVTAPFILKEFTRLVTPQPSPEVQAYEDLNKEFERSGIDLEMTPPSEDTQHNDEQYTTISGTQKVETMYQDIADTINTASASRMAEMLREERTKESERRAQKKKSTMNLMFAGAAVILLVVGFILVRRARTFEPEALVITGQEQEIPGLFRAEEAIALNVTPQTSVFQARDILGELMRQHVAPTKTFVHIYPTTTSLGVTRLASLDSLFNTFEIVPPASLVSALGRDYMYGLYGGNISEEVFLFTTINAVDGAFVGVREWETEMVRDMQDILSLREDVIQPSLYERTFIDEVVSNIPVRSLYAPTVTTFTETVVREQQVQDTPRRALPSTTLEAIEEITPTTIVFARPDDFLSNLSEGDVITSTASRFSEGFTRIIESFNLDEERLIIKTRDVSVSELTPDIPDNAELFLKTDDQGVPQRWIRYEEETTTYIEGTDVLVMMYAFLDNEHLVITTGIESIEAIIDRLSE